MFIKFRRVASQHRDRALRIRAPAASHQSQEFWARNEDLMSNRLATFVEHDAKRARDRYLLVSETFTIYQRWELRVQRCVSSAEFKIRVAVHHFCPMDNAVILGPPGIRQRQVA